MSTIALVARLVLAVVFAVAGIAKLRDRAGTRAAIVDFGGPESIAGVLALVLLLAELAVAGLLLPATTTPAGAAGGLALLALFSGAIAVSLARGRSPECHCFGQLHSAPASWKTLGRNAALAAVAGAALAGSLAWSRLSAVAWVGGLDAVQAVALGAGVALVALVAGGCVAFFSLLRSYGRVLVRLDRVERLLVENGLSLGEDDHVGPETGLAPGTPVAEFPELDQLLAPGLPLLLLFTSPRCEPCRTLLPQAAGWQVDHAEAMTIAFAIEGTPDEAHAEAAEHELEHVLVDEALQLYHAFEANGTPSAVLITPDGTVASRLATGAQQIERLVEVTTAPTPPEPGLAIGEQVPSLALPSLDGELVRFDDLRGRETLLVFWNPSCGYCRAMHEDLVSWEQTINGQGPRLVVVSSGLADSTRADGFRSLVLVDDGFAAGHALGASGTPMGLLLGADGRVASRLAIGGDAILALAKADG
jgi:thiol-disulfide isomerase/thioredoxin